MPSLNQLAFSFHTCILEKNLTGLWYIFMFTVVSYLLTCVKDFCIDIHNRFICSFIFQRWVQGYSDPKKKRDKKCLNNWELWKWSRRYDWDGPLEILKFPQGCSSQVSITHSPTIMETDLNIGPVLLDHDLSPIIPEIHFLVWFY